MTKKVVVRATRNAATHYLGNTLWEIGAYDKACADADRRAAAFDAEHELTKQERIHGLSDKLLKELERPHLGQPTYKVAVIEIDPDRYDGTMRAIAEALPGNIAGLSDWNHGLRVVSRETERDCLIRHGMQEAADAYYPVSRNPVHPWFECPPPRYYDGDVDGWLSAWAAEAEGGDMPLGVDIRWRV